jgi:hypothetical protein
VTITNGYASQAALKAELHVSDSDDDARFDAAINAASRQIDAHCGRRFWQDGSVVAREFYSDDYRTVCPGDISTKTGLIVKVDTGDDGQFATTLTINTHFLVRPFNAADEVPVWPYTDIVLTDATTAYFTRHASGRPNVQITAKFGWPAVPDDVTQACLIQAKNLYKATSGTFSGFQLSVEAGAVMRTPGMDMVAVALLEPYRKGWVG